MSLNVLGINGSPRQNGNSRFLMSEFMKQMQSKGYTTNVLDAMKLKLKSCVGCDNCERTGDCIFNKDDFTTVFLPALLESDILVLASPVYFYGFPGDIKRLIDRIQVFWSSKYLLKKNEFKNRHRKGILLATGATHGKNLFDGMKLTARYFFDAADISFSADLCYRGVDKKGQMERHPNVLSDIRELADRF